MHWQNSTNKENQGGFTEEKGILSRLGRTTEASSQTEQPVFPAEAVQKKEKPAPRSSGLSARPSKTGRWEDVKEELLAAVLNQLDFEALKGLSEEEIGERLRPSIREFIQEKVPLEFSDFIEQMVHEIHDELVGLGPLEPLMHDDAVTEIMVNGPDQIFVEKGGKIHLTASRFRGEGHLRRIIDRIVSRTGRRVDESSPMVNTRLADGSRVNAVIPPLVLDGSTLTIRRFSQKPLGPAELMRFGSITEEMATFLRAAVNGALNIVVSGGTGSGKTTFLNMLSGYIDPKERIVTIEDSAELQLQQIHVVRMETRMANIEGNGEVSIRELVKNALRMRPDRIVVGECRGGEAFDMLQAMNTGHDGSMTTLHANSPRDAVGRMVAMSLMAGMDMPERVIRRQIASAIDLIVQLERLPDGSRKVTRVSEVTGMEDEEVVIQDIYLFEGKSDAPGERIIGSHRPSGIRPHCADKLLALGQTLPRFPVRLAPGVYATDGGDPVELGKARKVSDFNFSGQIKF